MSYMKKTFRAPRLEEADAAPLPEAPAGPATAVPVALFDVSLFFQLDGCCSVNGRSTERLMNLNATAGPTTRMMNSASMLKYRIA